MANEADNPFRSPVQAVGQGSGSPPRRVDWRAVIAWPFVFAVNLAVPLLLGLNVVLPHGFIGMALAVLVIFVSGWGLCLWAPYLARRLLFGSVLTALSQLFPIVHFILGMIAFSITADLGFAVEDDDMGIWKATSEVGGFLITMLVACGLLGVAGGIGLVFGYFLPGAWFAPIDTLLPNEPREDDHSFAD